MTAADAAPIVTVESLASMSRREIAEWITAICRNVVALSSQRNEARAERDAIAQDLARMAARLAAVEALADEWENNEAYACRGSSECVRCITYQSVVIRLRRAALATEGGQS